LIWQAGGILPKEALSSCSRLPSYAGLPNEDYLIYNGDRRKSGNPLDVLCFAQGSAENVYECTAKVAVVRISKRHISRSAEHKI